MSVAEHVPRCPITSRLIVRKVEAMHPLNRSTTRDARTTHDARQTGHPAACDVSTAPKERYVLVAKSRDDSALDSCLDKLEPVLGEPEPHSSARFSRWSILGNEMPNIRGLLHGYMDHGPRISRNDSQECTKTMDAELVAPRTDGGDTSG